MLCKCRFSQFLCHFLLLRQDTSTTAISSVANSVSMVQSNKLKLNLKNNCFNSKEIILKKLHLFLVSCLFQVRSIGHCGLKKKSLKHGLVQRNTFIVL